MSPTVRCPHCKKSTEFSTENPHRPFCSQRCREADLGLWLLEKQAIAGEAASPEDLTEAISEQLSDRLDPEKRRH